MKTTIDITDSLLREAKKLAQKRGTTLRALVEEGLRREVRETAGKAKPFRLRDATFGGGGLTPEMQNADWEKWLQMIYGDRSG